MLFLLLKELVDSCLWLNCMMLDSLIKFEVLRNFRLPLSRDILNCLGRNGMDIAVDNRKKYNYLPLQKFYHDSNGSLFDFGG